MAFKDTASEFLHLDPALIDPDPAHPRRELDPASLKGLVNSIERKGLIHPLIVQPAGADGRYRLLVGERRRQAALLAGEKSVPVLVRACPADEMLEIQVFENMGLGVRAGLEPRDMARAIQQIAERFASENEAADQFGRSSTWLNQATAAAKLSPKVTALLDTGKIASTTTAVQIEKLARKDAASAEQLIERIEHLPEGEKLPRQVVDQVLSDAGVVRRKKTPAPVEAVAQPVPAAVPEVMPWEDLPEEAATRVTEPAINPPRRRVSAGKVRQVAEILGLGEDDEEIILERLIDEFLASRAVDRA